MIRPPQFFGESALARALDLHRLLFVAQILESFEQDVTQIFDLVFHVFSF
jgi:hypothetical protein